jgi:hypothetical protein
MVDVCKHYPELVLGDKLTALSTQNVVTTQQVQC